MKPLISPMFLGLFLLWAPSGYSQGSQDFTPLYGFKTTAMESSQLQWDVLETLYQKGGLFDQFKALKSGPLDFSVFEPYLQKLQDQNLLGVTLRDSFLLYFHTKYNKEFLDHLKTYESKSPAFTYIIKVRSHLENYSSQGFDFSTVLGPHTIPLGKLKLFLPRAPWTPLEKKGQSYILQAGNDDNAGLVSFQILEVPGSRADFLKTNYFMKPKSYFKQIPKDRDLALEDMYSIAPTEFKKIAENWRGPWGFWKETQAFDEVYEQITAPDQVYLQNGISRTRLFFKGNSCLAVNITDIISQHHALFDPVRIIQVLGYLLDTLDLSDFQFTPAP